MFEATLPWLVSVIIGNRAPASAPWAVVRDRLRQRPLALVGHSRVRWMRPFLVALAAQALGHLLLCQLVSAGVQIVAVSFSVHAWLQGTLQQPG